MYKVLIRPVLTYASETWTLLKINERRLGLFERRVLRRIFGAKQENGIWRKRYNYELYEMFNDSDIVVHIKVKRLAWAGHLILKISRSYSDTPNSVGILWTSDQTDAETSTSQHTTLTTDIHAPG